MNIVELKIYTLTCAAKGCKFTAEANTSSQVSELAESHWDEWTQETGSKNYGHRIEVTKKKILTREY